MELLLRLHHEHRIAHVLGAPERLMASFADSFMDVSRGAVTSWSRSESERRFEAYLGGARFLEWDDVAPPVIRISSDRTLAVVTVAKRVRVLLETPAEGLRHDARRYAWTETWEWRADAWRLTAIASTDRPETEPDTVPLSERLEAIEILHAAREALGGHEAVASVAMLSFTATCEGPGGPFTTRVRSARDGRFAFRQSFPDRPTVEAGISLAGAWRAADGAEIVDSLRAVERGIFRAHELHLLALAPESRFLDPRAAGRETVAGHPVRIVRFRDPDGGRVEFFYHADTGLPVGFRLLDPPGPNATTILTVFDDWRAVGPVRLPFGITITRGDDLFRYLVSEASSVWLSDRAFAPEVAS